MTHPRRLLTWSPGRSSRQIPTGWSIPLLPTSALSDMDRRIPLWAALSICAAVLIGCGIFFALQDLGTANDYATIGSFFLALVAAAGSLLSFARSKQQAEAAARHEARQSQQPSSGSMINHGNIGNYQSGPGAVAHIVINRSGQASQVKKRRKR